MTISESKEERVGLLSRYEAPLLSSRSRPKYAPDPPIDPDNLGRRVREASRVREELKVRRNPFQVYCTGWFIFSRDELNLSSLKSSKTYLSKIWPPKKALVIWTVVPRSTEQRLPSPSDWPWLERANELADKDDEVDAGLDLVYSNVRRLAEEGNFSDLNNVCRVSVDQLNVDISLGILCATFRFKDRLDHRSALYKSIEEYFDRIGILEEGLLTGLD